MTAFQFGRRLNYVCSHTLGFQLCLVFYEIMVISQFMEEDRIMHLYSSVLSQKIYMKTKAHFENCGNTRLFLTFFSTIWMNKYT